MPKLGEEQGWDESGESSIMVALDSASMDDTWDKVEERDLSLQANDFIRCGLVKDPCPSINDGR